MIHESRFPALKINRERNYDLFLHFLFPRENELGPTDIHGIAKRRLISSGVHLSKTEENAV